MPRQVDDSALPAAGRHVAAPGARAMVARGTASAGPSHVLAVPSRFADWRAAATVHRWMPRFGQTGLPVLAMLGVAGFFRFWQLDRVGFNSDEAVYSGTAASIAGNDTLRTMFPVFRAHPVLLQVIVSFWMHGGVSDWAARAVAAAIGVVAVGATYVLARRLYGHRAGLVAGFVLAVMPYHVIVSRQVLLDGLMTLLATVTLYCVVRYSESAAPRWMVAAGAMMGVTVLSKETSIVLVGGLYAFFALSPAVRLRLRHILLGLLVMVAVVSASPLAVSFSGHVDAGGSYLVWQLFRRSNHEMLFYLRHVPTALGIGVVGAAVLGLVWLRRENTWRERLLLAWIVVPAAFFTLWPVKGYQYLLPIAPAFAVLAGRTIDRIGSVALFTQRRWMSGAAVAVLALCLTISLAVPSWNRINPSTSRTFLAGTGGVPGGREAGLWLRDHVPPDAQLLAIGPSMANILEFYGRRHVFALSVSSTPANRNPAYLPVPNPDLAVRRGDFQYLVWDSYTAVRAPSFGAKIVDLIHRYNGVAVFTATVTSRSRSGTPVVLPVVTVYQVQPL